MGPGDPATRLIYVLSSGLRPARITYSWSSTSPPSRSHCRRAVPTRYFGSGLPECPPRRSASTGLPRAGETGYDTVEPLSGSQDLPITGLHARPHDSQAVGEVLAAFPFLRAAESAPRASPIHNARYP